MTTTTTEDPAVAKARKRVEALLEANAQDLAREKRGIDVSIEVITAKKSERVTLLRLLEMLNGNAEDFELGEVSA